MTTPTKPKRGYWIETTGTFCVLCGREDLYRTRIYDRRKPADPYLRTKIREDACDHHFM